MAPQVIHFDYEFSPYGQKTKLLLTASGVEYTKCDQPAVLPRPDLEALGITYRRIPLMAVGKDVYADSSLMIDTIVSKLGKIPTSPSDKAYEAWSNTVFGECLGLIPPQVLTKDFVEDRKTIFPMLTRSDILEMRPSALASFKARCVHVETQFLAGGGPFIGGEKISLADVHVAFVLRWIMNNLGMAKEPGFGKQDFPKMWKMIESLPATEPAVRSTEETQKAIRGGEYFAPEIGVSKSDASGLEKGAKVNVESLDAVPGSHPQLGSLFGLNDNEIVLEVNDGIRLHFPRVGYLLKKPQMSKM